VSLTLAKLNPKLKVACVNIGVIPWKMAKRVEAISSLAHEEYSMGCAPVFQKVRSGHFDNYLTPMVMRKDVSRVGATPLDYTFPTLCGEGSSRRGNFFIEL
jgi:hypothetical protein